VLERTCLSRGDIPDLDDCDPALVVTHSRRSTLGGMYRSST
jgi:hypothetical protein